ncbi:MAG: caspase family protein [Pirellulaceae bacterium]|nr:caspase family protein [Pirellulaceae bacterium]
MQAAIFVAVEKYADSQRIKDVKYAEAGARQFAAVLEQHGFGPADRELLMGGEATKTALESVLRTTLKRLTAGDTLFLFYAGHGFSRGGENYLTCHDSRLADLELTSIPLQTILRQLQQSSCQRIVLFLDSSSTGLLASELLRGSYGNWDDAELEAFFGSAEQRVCFAACQAGESSHSSSELQHRIWTHHVIQAFDGRNRTALQGTRLTAASLQNYLAAAVPATLKKTDPSAVQTPRRYGAAAGDFLLADMEEVFAHRKAARHPLAGQVKDSILLKELVVSVRSFPGFAKGYSVPDSHNSRAQAFIHELAAADIEEDAQRVRAALKREFRFTRLQLSVKNHGEGAATVTTPYFNYNVSVEQAPQDPGSVLWKRTVDAIKDPDKILSDQFGSVFAQAFDTVELSLHDHVNLDQLIDAIEALDSDEIDVDYDHDENVDSCVVAIQGYKVSIQVTRDTFSIVHPTVQSPKVLVQSLFDIQLALTEKHKVLAIPFAAVDSHATGEP